MSQDPYIYENGVLKNRFNIRDSDELDQRIANIVTLKIFLLKRNPQFKIDKVYKILDIHKYIFGSIFEWAGKIRTITMYKREPILNGCSVDYTPDGYIEKELKDADILYQSIKWESLSQTEKIKNIALVVAEVWRVHPFREGNTRTTSIFLYYLLIQNGFTVRYKFLQKYSKYFRNALVLASLYTSSEPEYLEGIIANIVSTKGIKTGRYQTIAGYEVERYQYCYHTLQKLKMRCEKKR